MGREIDDDDDDVDELHDSRWEIWARGLWRNFVMFDGEFVEEVLL